MLRLGSGTSDVFDGLGLIDDGDTVDGARVGDGVVLTPAVDEGPGVGSFLMCFGAVVCCGAGALLLLLAGVVFGAGRTMA